ncbi:MAG: hypothetical protein ACK2T5_04730 [Anaerolineales bacterium]
MSSDSFRCSLIGSIIGEWDISFYVVWLHLLVSFRYETLTDKPMGYVETNSWFRPPFDTLGMAAQLAIEKLVSWHPESL